MSMICDYQLRRKQNRKESEMDLEQNSEPELTL